MNQNLALLESIISVFSIINGEVKLLLVKKKTEPYRGYWMLPGEDINFDETAEDAAYRVINERLNFKLANLEQYYSFTKPDRYTEERIIAIGLIALIDGVSANIIKEENEGNVDMDWFNINNIPKLAFDHDEITKVAIHTLRNRIVNTNALKYLFPSDFTLPELQKAYEQILNRPLDRRNFRKKFINLDLIEDTGYKNEGFNGRPAKLYRFKEELKEKTLF